MNGEIFFFKACIYLLLPAPSSLFEHLFNFLCPLRSRQVCVMVARGAACTPCVSSALFHGARTSDLAASAACLRAATLVSRYCCLDRRLENRGAPGPQRPIPLISLISLL